MGLFSKLFGSNPQAGRVTAPAEQAVLLHLDSAELHDVAELENQLISIIDKQQLGEFDGNEFGADEVTLFMYGPDAEKLFAAIAPTLKAHRLGRKGIAIIRMGPPGATERRVDLDAD